MELNSENQSLADSKIMVLYIISKIGKPISDNELLELVSSILEMNYFDYQEVLLDLLEDDYINQYDQESNSIYEITEKGTEAINFTIDSIPGIFKLRIDSRFRKNLDEVKDKFSISAEYSPITDKSFSIRCKIIENNNIIFDIQADAGSKEQSKKIVDNWNNHAADIYPKILELLVNGTDTENK